MGLVDALIGAGTKGFLMRRQGIVLGSLIGLLVACGTVAESYELDRGGVLEGDHHLVVVDATLQEGSIVEGNLNITAAEEVDINGRVQGDLTVWAQGLSLGPEAYIEGDVIYCLGKSGDYQADNSAFVMGRVRDNCDDTAARLDREGSDWWWQSLLTLVAILGAALLAALVSIFLPKSLNRIAHTSQSHKLHSVGLGFFTLVVAIGLSSLWGWSLRATIPVLLAPVFLVVWVGVVVLMLLGFLALAQVFGRWVIRSLGRTVRPPVLANILGAVILSLILLGFQWMVPLRVIGDIAWISLGSWGLGATLFTYARTYPNRS